MCVCVHARVYVEIREQFLELIMSTMWVSKVELRFSTLTALTHKPSHQARFGIGGGFETKSPASQTSLDLAT